MKIQTVVIYAIAIIATFGLGYLGLSLYQRAHERSGLQRLVDMTKPDISSEGGLYGHYRIYTGMLLCKGCESIATRLILKSENELSPDGVSTFETTKIYTGEKPLKQPIQKAIWTTMKGNTNDPGAQYIALFTDQNKVATFLIDQTEGKDKWKYIVEATDSGDPLSSSENRIGKLILMSEGNTIP